MDSLGGSFSQEDLFDFGLRDIIHPGDVLNNTLPHKGNSQRVSIAACTDDLIKDSFGSFASIGINGLIADKFRIEDARDDFSEEGDRFLMELLRVSDIAEGDFIEGIL